MPRVKFVEDNSKRIAIVTTSKLSDKLPTKFVPNQYVLMNMEDYLAIKSELKEVARYIEQSSEIFEAVVSLRANLEENS